MVEDANIGMDHKGIYVAQQIGGFLVVPKGYLNSGENLNVSFSRYKDGTPVPMADSHNTGFVAIRAMGFDSKCGWFLTVSKQ